MNQDGFSIDCLWIWSRLHAQNAPEPNSNHQNAQEGIRTPGNPFETSRRHQIPILSGTFWWAQVDLGAFWCVLVSSSVFWCCSGGFWQCVLVCSSWVLVRSCAFWWALESQVRSGLLWWILVRSCAFGSVLVGPWGSDAFWRVLLVKSFIESLRIVFQGFCKLVVRFS